MPDANKTFVITGASRGLGAALAECALEVGHRVGVCSRSLPPFSNRDSALAESLDVGDPAALEAFATRVAERFGSIDVWVNNAAVLDPVGPLALADPAKLTGLVSTNILGTLHGSRIFAAMARTQGSPAVLLNVSSGAARRALAGLGPYCASKAAVERLSECLALEEGPHLRVHSVSPGVIATDMQDTLRAQDEETLPDVQAFRGFKESGTLVTPRDAALRLLALATHAPDDPEQVCVDLHG